MKQAARVRARALKAVEETKAANDLLLRLKEEQRRRDAEQEERIKSESFWFLCASKEENTWDKGHFASYDCLWVFGKERDCVNGRQWAGCLVTKTWSWGD